MSIFNRIFRVSTFGESHSNSVGCVVEGVPAQLKLKEEDIQPYLDRRRPGQSSITTPRNEGDKVQILSGTENGVTLGTPICLVVKNEDFKKTDYNEFDAVPRPGHADYTYLIKYGIKASSGGGRSSARETIGRVAAGAIAEKLLNENLNLYIVSWVSSVGDVQIPKEEESKLLNEFLSKEEIDKRGSFLRNYIQLPQQEQEQYLSSNQYQPKEIINTRCPHEQTAIKMIILIQSVKNDKDSIGGTIVCNCQNVPAGFGEPCFDKLEALLAHAMLSIPATKAFEIGSGFEGTKMRGSLHNDKFILNNNSSENTNTCSPLKTSTNYAGGTLGGISNGENIYFRVGFKPVSTIGLPQETTDLQGNKTILEAKGRHDPCVLPRAPPIVEAMAALVLVDCYLLQTKRI